MNESNINGVSIRSILAFVIVVSCCVIAMWTKDLGVLKDLAFLVLGFYFGQKPAVPTNTTTTTASTTIPEAPKTGV
jgi:hypothetical protein